jgi:transposase
MSTSKSTTKKFSPEVRERAVRMVFEHQEEYESQWAAMASIAQKIGCTTETLRKWVRQAERNQGRTPGLTTDERERLKALERESKELRRANENSAQGLGFFFAQAELDHSGCCFKSMK